MLFYAFFLLSRNPHALFVANFTNVPKLEGEFSQFLHCQVFETIWSNHPNLSVSQCSGSDTYFFIGPDYDHWLPLSLTHSHLVDLIDVTLACEDANPKLIEIVTVV